MSCKPSYGRDTTEQPSRDLSDGLPSEIKPSPSQTDSPMRWYQTQVVCSRPRWTAVRYLEAKAPNTRTTVVSWGHVYPAPVPNKSLRLNLNPHQMLYWAREADGVEDQPYLYRAYDFLDGAESFSLSSTEAVVASRETLAQGPGNFDNAWRSTALPYAWELPLWMAAHMFFVDLNWRRYLLPLPTFSERPAPEHAAENTTDRDVLVRRSGNSLSQ